MCRRDRSLAKQRGYRRFMIARHLDRVCYTDQSATDQTELIQPIRRISQTGFGYGPIGIPSGIVQSRLRDVSSIPSRPLQRWT